MVGQESLKDIYHLLSRVVEVDLGQHPLEYYGDLVVELGCLYLGTYATQVDAGLVGRDHHLPLLLVPAHSAVSRASKLLLVVGRGLLLVNGF